MSKPELTIEQAMEAARGITILAILSYFQLGFIQIFSCYGHSG